MQGSHTEPIVTIEDRSFDFALDVIKIYKYLNSNKEYIMAKQLLRSGTSIGANIQEAQAAQSRNDFIAKMSIASKEARETKYWLRLLDSSGYLNNFSDRDKTFTKINAIINIVTKIVKTSQTKNK
jgi:four helix bundle protein